MEREWWKEAVAYQIYPRSFNDSNGDGIGDLQGILQKMDYIDNLGVDMVWLNPIYSSPNKDNGYDISDYRSIMDEFGDIEDFEELLEKLHSRDIRLIMDMVVNHTSVEHEWFQKSRRKEEGFADFYIWTDEPNNWESKFGGSAWSYDEERGEYYLHLFDESQADLNWRNPEVRSKIFDMMNWWLDKGIDGFRLDVINVLSKPSNLPQGNPNSEWIGQEHFVNESHIHEILNEMQEEVFSDRDIITVGEMTQIDPESASTYFRKDNGIDMIFSFDHQRVNFGEDWWDLADWDAEELAEVFSRWHQDQEIWNAWFLTNHDWPRAVSKFGDEEYRERSAKMLATLLLTLRGTPFIYQGDEIGMTNYPFKKVEDIDDILTRDMISDHFGKLENIPNEAAEIAKQRTRDNSRTPMQWSDKENAGFSRDDPWRPVNPNYTEINVEAQEDNPNSVLDYYQELIQLRKKHNELVYGDYRQEDLGHQDIYALSRELEGRKILAMLNFGKESIHVDQGKLPDETCLLISNYGKTKHSQLKPYEARIYSLKV